MRRLSLDVVVSEKDELYKVFWGKKNSDSSNKVVTKKYKLCFFWEILWETVEVWNSKAQSERDF